MRGHGPTITNKGLTNHGPSSTRNLEPEYSLVECQKGPPELRGGWWSRNQNRELPEGLLQ